jgi:hypothetical protein
MPPLFRRSRGEMTYDLFENQFKIRAGKENEPFKNKNISSHFRIGYYF